MKYSKRRYEAVYEKLAYTCDAPLDGDLFKMAMDQGHVDAYLDREIELDDLAFEIDGYATMIRLSDEIRQGGDPSHPKPESTEQPVDHRSQALNAIFAVEAAARNDVTSFRSKNLEDGLLNINDVATWIERVAEIDSPATVWITVPEDALDEARISNESTLSRLPGYSEDTELLHYVTGGSRYTLSIPICYRGILADLADAAHWVAMRYGWGEGATTTFILTGLPPAAIGIRAQKIEPWPSTEHRRRIQLDIPLSATSDDVARIFLRLRKEMLGDKPRSRRSLTKQSADLAVFAARHSSGHTWEEARTIWNQSYKNNDNGWYENPAQFIRDSRSAYKRITGRKLKWKGKQSKATHSTGEPKET